MQKVIKITEAVATRTLELLDELTGSRDICFDDSALVSNRNFEFMQEGERYNCLIKLFGEVAQEGQQTALPCSILGDELVGCKRFVKVLTPEGIYYIPQQKVQAVNTADFLFVYTRKDLIQVDHVTHGDLISE